MKELPIVRKGERYEFYRTVSTLQSGPNGYNMVHIACSDLYLSKVPAPTPQEARILQSLRNGQDGEPDNQQAAHIIAARRDMVLELRLQHLTNLIEARRLSRKKSRERYQARHPEKAKKKTNRWLNCRWWSGRDIWTWK